MTLTITHEMLPKLAECVITECILFEVHPDGGVFIPAHTAREVTQTITKGLALHIHRSTLEASPAAEESDYYEQYALAADKVPGNVECELHHDRDTNTVTATYTVHAPMYLTGEGVSEFLKMLHQVIDRMDALTDRDRPVNAAAHLLEAADRIEEYAVKTDSENWADVAAHLFAQYLVIFSAREYECDYTPVEHLEDALLSEDDYTALEDAGLIAPGRDDSGNLSSYFLLLFAGD